MDTSKFIEKFSALLPQTPAGTLSPETEFKKLPDWNSLVALSVIAMVEDEYDVLLKSADIRTAGTLGELAGKIADAQ